MSPKDHPEERGTDDDRIVTSRTCSRLKEMQTPSLSFLCSLESGSPPNLPISLLSSCVSFSSSEMILTSWNCRIWLVRKPSSLLEGLLSPLGLSRVTLHHSRS